VNPPLHSTSARSAFRKRLLAWFERHRRELPWRADRDPYRIWISEVMLQQTTVAAVVPHFKRFLAAFPTLQALAAASEQDVLKQWEGLGYYRRARHLHAAAKRLAELDSIPDDPAVWSELPGVGRYILGAVLSQAFDRKLPIVEANTLRVLARLFAYPGDPREGEGKTWVWSAAESLLPAQRVGDFNQAMMELGALVCTPVSPRCSECPVSAYCDAKRAGAQDRIPPPKRRKDVVTVREAAVVIRDRDNVLLCLRPANAGRWQNMWEFPHAELTETEDSRTGAVRISEELTGLRVELGDELTIVRHAVTHHSIAMVCFDAVRRAGRFRSAFYAEGRWLAPRDLGDLPASTPQRTLIDLIRGQYEANGCQTGSIRGESRLKRTHPGPKRAAP
jgi:A/G-specific adenine glycosylase